MARANNADTPLHWTAAACSEEAGIDAARALLNAGADVNALNRAYVTPYQRALDMRRTALAALLLSRGGRIGATFAGHNDPLVF